jgi:hypothetical protein
VSDEQKVPTFVRILISVTNPQQNTCDRSLHGGARLSRPREAFEMLRAKLPAETGGGISLGALAKGKRVAKRRPAAGLGCLRRLQSSKRRSILVYLGWSLTGHAG